MDEQTCYGKLIEIANGSEIYIKKIPCVIGKISIDDNINYLDSRAYIGKTINLDSSYCNISEINEHSVKHKLIIEKCKTIEAAHLILYYDFKLKEFKIRGLSQFYLNEDETVGNDCIIRSFDKISFNCNLCYTPHIYVILLPKREEETRLPLHSGVYSQSINAEILSEGMSMKKLPDLALANKWTSHEKECLRKYILIYGYGRWQMLKQNSGGVLSDKSESEIKIFANAFIKTIVELLPGEKSELRKFLVNLIEESPEDAFILPRKDDWGTLIKQRAPAWGKRIQLLYRVSLIIEKFKSERKRNKEIRKSLEEKEKENQIHSLENRNNNIEQPTQMENLSHLENEGGDNIPEVNKTYDYWDNLLNFLPNHAFYGQRPSVWWTRTHDIDLLRGTYKYGYANYSQMRSDPKLSFSKLEKDSSFQEFPNADTITRRLKKLIQLIVKSESNNGIISFEDRQNIKEPTGFTLEEKIKIVDFLIDQGVPLSEGKSDWVMLRDILIKLIDLDQSKTAQMIERLVQRLRMISQLVIQLNDSPDNEVSIDENMMEQMDPDNDGFNISFEEAEKLNKNMNILHFIRKHIITDGLKLFNNGLNTLNEVTKSGHSLPSNLPNSWDCSIHDKNILIAVEENGFKFLHSLSGDKQYNFEDVKMDFDDMMARVNFLCEFFRDFSSGNKTKKKKDTLSMLMAAETHTVKKKSSKLQIQKDSEGNIIYPITINSSLQILNLGTIEWERSAYHTEKNLFPIGFKAVREHASMTRLGERALYTCEILDGGSKPMYKLTPHEEEDSPIVKESSTGCWIVVCNRINALQGNKRTKVTISGTERFGLCENNVVKLLQALPNSEKCSRYTLKNFEES